MPWWLALLFIFLVVGVAAVGVRWFLHRRRLEALGRHHRMQRPSTNALEDVLRSVPEDWGKAGLRDALMGRDGSGRYLAGRSGRGPAAQEVFLAELNRHTPARGLSLRSHEYGHPNHLQMQWNLTPEQALDAQSRDIVQRVLREFAAFKLHHAGLVISLEVGERGAVIHAPYRGEEGRTEFIAAARVLRRDLLHCLYRRGTTAERPVAAPAAELNTQPVTPVRTEEPVADPEVERALESLDAKPMVTIRELVTEKPPPPTRKGWKRVGYREIFTVPEPEEEVEIISAQASSTRRKKLMEDDDEKTKVIDFLP